MGHNREEVIATVSIAFASARYPGDDRIVPPDRDWDWESQEIKQAFRGRRWEDAGVDFLCPTHRTDLGFLTPEAFAYYLPAFLIAATEIKTADVLIDSLLWQLCHGRSSDSLFRRASGLMLPDQLRAILTLIAYLRSENWGGEDDPDLAEAEESVLLALRAKEGRSAQDMDKQ